MEIDSKCALIGLIRNRMSLLEKPAVIRVRINILSQLNDLEDLGNIPCRII